ncbi:MAG: ABC transporter ATP-binding protein [Desulfomonile sp.]|jgi:branched-chain amino acid transport system ATP-binding protein
MLRVEGLEKSFDRFLAVKQANLTVDDGEIVAVIGPNGAGKSTLFKLIAGHLKPDKGKVIFKGEDITGLPPHQICKKGIGLSFQVVNVFSRLTVFENVRVAVLSHQEKTFKFLSSAHTSAVKETNEILDSVGLCSVSNRISGSLSHGEQKVLEMAIALGTYPQLLILDEPTAGMSPEETSNMISLINRLTRELGLTILFCEHDMDLVFAIAGNIMVMQQGVTIIQGHPEDIRSNVLVQEAYLGGAD